jgi:hypothetical protein
MITFAKGQRKDDIAHQRCAEFTQDEGVVFIGKAQEKCTVYRTEKHDNPRTHRSYAWIVKSTALVNHYYFYCLDRGFGPFFLKFCSYFPYNAKLCLNGHEYVKRQLEQRRIQYQALDNGVLSCAEPKRLQALCDGLSGEKIEALLLRSGVKSAWFAQSYTRDEFLTDVECLLKGHVAFSYGLGRGWAGACTPAAVGTFACGA